MCILDELLSPLAANFASVTKSRKRKRDESLVSTVNENPGAVIRLVSEKPTVVSTSEPVDGQSKTYLSEDTIEEAEERKRRAVQVAVDFEIIRKQSTIRYPNFKEVASQKYNWKSISAPTTIAVVQCPKPKKSRPIYPLSKPIQLKTREPRVKQSLVVDVRSSHPVPPKVEREFVPHTFYHSDETVGGKSAGYAWGYRGSFPRPAGITGYLRDNMRNGLDMMVAGREAGTTQAVEAKLNPGGLPPSNVTEINHVPLFVGGYKFQPEDLAPLSPNVIGVPYKPGLMEGSTVFKLKAMLKCDILPIIDDTELGNHYYMLITQSNESGQGFPFTEDEEDIRQFAAMEAWGLQHREWVVLQDPKLTVITR